MMHSLLVFPSIELRCFGSTGQRVCMGVTVAEHVRRSRGRDRVPQSRAGQGAAVAGRDGGYCEPEYSGGRQCFSSQV